MIKKEIVLIAILILVLISCRKSEENPVGPEPKTEIEDNSVLSSDVNAEDYWNTTELVWQDEFDGNTLASSKWLFELGSAGIDFAELQNYTEKDNIEVSNGTLKITAKKTGEGQNAGDYTSARLNSKFAFTYGRLEMRAKLPDANGNGLWAKLWMLGTNINEVFYPTCGEIAFMEYVSHLPNEIYSTVHTAETGLGNGSPINSGPVSSETAEEEFHIYGVLWTDEYLKFYIDDIENVFYTVVRPSEPNINNWPFSESQYFVMNIAVGGAFGGAEGVDDSIFPATMEIDYVRVYHAK